MVPRPSPCFTEIRKVCFRKELDGASDDDDYILLPRMMFMAFSSCLAAQMHKQLSWGFLASKENAQKRIWKDKNCNKFSGIIREGCEALIFLSGS
jgi:hypothetical protein